MTATARRVLFLVLAVLFGCVVVGVSTASAHVRSESNSLWEINGRDIDLVMTIPNVEVQRLAIGGAPPSDARMEAYLAGRIYPLDKGGRCALVPPVTALSAASGFRRYDFTFRCANADDLRIHSGAFFDVAPSHTNFAQIQDATTDEFTEQLITAEHQTIDVTDREGAKLKRAGFLEFVGMGVMHIFTGIDHMSFLIGLVLISRRLRDLIFVVTGFTIGHSLTLALAVTGVIRPHAEYIDALVALTIALIGAENIAVATRRPGVIAGALVVITVAMVALKLTGLGGLPSLLLLGAGLFTANYLMISGHLRDAARLRMVITLVFGLIHGFGFAAGLLEMQLPTERLAELLVGFNVGVEIGQLSVVLAVTLLVLALRKSNLALPRAITVEVTASILVGFGVFWFVSRAYA